MSYREEMKQMIMGLLTKMPPENEKLDRAIRKVYAKALEEAKQTGGSIESMTYEVLEGIEEALSIYPELIESTLQRSAFLMADLLHHSAKVDIAKREKRLACAKDALDEVIKAEKMHLMESLDAFKAYAQDHQYVQFEKSLDFTASTITHYVLKLAGEMMYNHEDD